MGILNHWIPCEVFEVWSSSLSNGVYLRTKMHDGNSGLENASAFEEPHYGMLNVDVGVDDLRLHRH